MEQHKEFPNFWIALLILALLLGIQIIIGITAYDLGYVYEAGDPKATGLITILSCGIVFSVLMSYKKIRYKDIFNPSSNSVISMILILTIPLLLSLGGSIFWLSDITNLILLYFPMADSEYLMFTRLFSGGVVSIIVVCFIAPVVEEMLFRGIFLRSFLVNYSALKAIILSSLLFGLFHLNIYQIPVAFILGSFFGWLYVRTESLWPCILAHSIYNTFAMLFLASSDIYNKEDAQLAVEFNSIGVNVVAISSTVIGIILLVYILTPRIRLRP